MTGGLPALVVLVVFATGCLAWLLALVLALVGLARALVAAWTYAVAAAVRRL
ncbi:hypothetical protein OHA91_22935 [Streptomyces erythrochromogenes]|uniref:Uncharacterized protein n=1 Tax=Streptomyces erythrochromogenes TaxID=285574 RepID=A0ABZ1QGR8_9ACTN|nr:hypothetical protein [Streptomyces erythrochromogenes]